MSARSDLKAKILSYMSQVQIATRNDISKAVQKTGSSLTKALTELVSEGSLELISENPLTYKFVQKNIFEIDLFKIKSYYDLKFKIFKILRDNGWRVSTHEIAAIALMYVKFTKLRLLIFGSQGTGKTSIISSIFEVKEPIVLQDLHLKNLYEVVYSVKQNTKIIEQQYRHNWGKETLEKYDSYKVVPLARIGPSELIFRFIPLRIPQPKRPARGEFIQIRLDFQNVPPIKKIPDDLFLEFESELANLKYFTIDNDTLENVIEDLKYNEMASYNSNDLTTAELHRTEVRYRKLTKNDFTLANLKILHEREDLYIPFNSNLQLINNALEVLKFNYAWLKDEDKAIEQTLDFLKDVFGTFTIVKDKRIS